VGLALRIMQVKMFNVTDTAPSRLAAFKTPEIFREMAPKILIAADAAVIEDVGSWDSVASLVSQFGMTSKGTSRHSKQLPCGPYFLAICPSTNFCPNISEAQGSLPMDILEDLIFFETQEVTQEIDLGDLEKDFKLFSFYQTSGWTRSFIPPINTVDVEAGVSRIARPFASSCPNKDSQTQPTIVEIKTFQAVFSRINKHCIMLAGKRMYKKFGRGAFMVRFGSMEDCMSGRLETMEETVSREARMVSHNMKVPIRFARKQTRLYNIPTPGLVLDECIVYVTLPWLKNTHKDLGKDMVFVHVYDPDTTTLIFTEVSRAQEPGFEFDDILMCLSAVHQENTRSNAQDILNETDSELAATPPKSEVTEPHVSQEDRLRLAVQASNSRARDEKLARRKKMCGGQKLIAINKKERTPEVLPNFENEIKKSFRPKHRKCRMMTDEEHKSARILQTVQRKIVDKDTIDDVEKHAVRATPVVKVKLPSKSRQKTLVLHLDEFQEAQLR